MRRKKILEMMKAILTLCLVIRSYVKVAAVTSEKFGVEVDVHQGYVLSPILFIILMDVATREAIRGVQWKLLLAKALLSVAESEEVLKAFERWREGMEARCLRVN